LNEVTTPVPMCPPLVPGQVGTVTFLLCYLPIKEMISILLLRNVYLIDVQRDRLQIVCIFLVRVIFKSVLETTKISAIFGTKMYLVFLDMKNVVIPYLRVSPARNH
jgi:hypothetical protein